MAGTLTAVRPGVVAGGRGYEPDLVGPTPATTAGTPLADAQVGLLGGLLVLDVLGQRLALPLGGSAQVPIGLVAGVVVAVLGVRRGLLRQEPARVRLALLALLALTVSTAVSLVVTRSVSVLSYLYVVLTYVPFAVVLVGGDGQAVLRRLVERFVRLSLVLAAVTILQTALQFVGLTKPDLLGTVVPKALLLKNYNTVYPFTYGSPYYKANGLVFLEPSFCCQFMAIAILGHLWLRRSGYAPLLLLAAMVTTVAGTGFILLAVGLAPLLPRASAVLRPLVPAFVVAVVVAAVTPLGGLIVGRLSEGGGSNSSTGLRFVAPFTVLGGGWLSDGFRIAFGAGPGQAQPYIQHVAGKAAIVPLVPIKLLFEYGAVATLVFLLFVLWSVVSGSHSPSLTAGLVTAYLLLSGSLQQPATVLVLWLFTSACAATAARPPARREHRARRPRRRRLHRLVTA